MFCSFTRASGMPGKPGFSDPFFLSFNRVLTKLPVTLPRVPRFMSDRRACSTQRRSGQPLGMPWLTFPTILPMPWPVDCHDDPLISQGIKQGTPHGGFPCYLARFQVGSASPTHPHPSCTEGSHMAQQSWEIDRINARCSCMEYMSIVTYFSIPMFM